MKTINLADTSSVINAYLSELRDIHYQQNRQLFRNNIRRIGLMMAYEISRTLDYLPQDVRTPLGTAHTRLASDRIVIGTVLRAGLPFHTGFLEAFDHADNAFVSAYRIYKDDAHTKVGIHVEYMASPNLDGSTLILVDPMLATGGSMELAYKALLRNGTPKTLHMASVIATPDGIAALNAAMPEDSTLWTAAIDPEMNEHKYILPGFGDAGDLCFGDKL